MPVLVVVVVLEVNPVLASGGNVLVHKHVLVALIKLILPVGTWIVFGLRGDRGLLGQLVQVAWVPKL